jgi:hypothetical protein
VTFGPAIPIHEPGRCPQTCHNLVFRMPFLRRLAGTAALLCLLLAIVHTWPLAADPGTHSRNDNGDAQLNEWILAWVAHQLPRAPARLFDANIFYPERDTLAYSEPLIVQGLMSAPLRGMGASPVLAFNVVLLLGFALTAWTGHRLVYHWTGSQAAGLLAGSMFAFNTHMLTRLAHIQGIHAWGLPLALLATDRLIVHTRTRDAAWLAFWMLCLAATSGYLAVFGAVLVGVAVVARLPWWWRRGRAVVPRFALAGVLAAIATAPIAIPYQRVATEHGMVRSIENVADFSVPLKSYITSAGRLHYWLWSSAFFKDPIDPFFPGATVLVLAALALVWTARPNPSDTNDDRLLQQRVVMLVAIAAAGLVLSLGTRTPVYGWFYDLFPPARGLRAAARFGNLLLLAVAALGGIGLAQLLRRVAAPRAAWIALAVIAVANAESLRAPFKYTPFQGIPAIYSHLATVPGRVVLVEVPFYPPHAIFQNATYVVNSTAHFRPLMNGYSGYMPGSYRTYAEQFRDFPQPDAIRAMRAAGATHVMVHPSRFHQGPEFAAQVLEQAASSPQLERLVVGRDDVTLFKLR